MPSLRLLEPRPLTSGRDSKSAAKGLHGNKANPWLPLGPGGIFKVEQAWTNRKGRQARRKDWNLRLALSELCQGACLQGTAADLEAEAKTMPFGSPKRACSKTLLTGPWLVRGLTDSADCRGDSEIHREILAPVCDSVGTVISYAIVTESFRYLHKSTSLLLFQKTTKVRMGSHTYKPSTWEVKTAWLL